MPVPETGRGSLIRRWARYAGASGGLGTAVVIGISVVLIITSLLMMLLVLLHKGKGGGLSDLFGGGVTSTLGSSSVVERNLDRITVFFGILWFVCIIALNFLVNH